MKSLIVITTCNRLIELKKNIIPYLQFCNNNNEFDFVVSLDGNEIDYKYFCDKYNIPLIWSNKREGVGLSKNRVLLQFPDYDFYFFIEDDVELYNSTIFSKCIELHKETNYHHFSANHTIGVIKKEEFLKLHLTHTKFGGGYFLFYTSECLKVIGGWHVQFAEYLRYGHTEHTYRAYFNEMNPSPFIFFEEARNMIILNDPKHVSNDTLKHNENDLINEEQEMIDKKQKYQPVITLSKYYFNGKNTNISNLPFEFKGERYSLIDKTVKRHALATYYFHKFKLSNNPIFLIFSFIHQPKHNMLKHYIKIKWLTWKLNH